MFNHYRSNTMQSTLLTGLLALCLAPLVEASSATKTTTRTIFLPSRATGSATNIYASVITESSSTTEFLLACQTAFSSPYDCGGDFNGVTLTYGPSIMDIAFGATEYDCQYGTTAVCQTRTTSSGPEATNTLIAEDLSSRMTAITIIDATKQNKTKETKTAQATGKGSSGLCKRRITHNSGDGADADSGGSGSSSSSDSTDTKKKTNGDDCSAGSLTIAIGQGLLFLSIAAMMKILI